MNKNKLLFSVGKCTEGDYPASVGGKVTKAYDVWKSMIMRCYSKKYHETRPTYIGCSVCEDWLDFQNFTKWFYNNYPENKKGYQLDKDLKFKGNKIYSPETCLFVPQEVNKFTNNHSLFQGKYLLGVKSYQDGLRFVAQCRNPLTGKREHIGIFDDEESAHRAWLMRKSEIGGMLAMKQDDLRVRDALLAWVSSLNSERSLV